MVRFHRTRFVCACAAFACGLYNLSSEWKELPYAIPNAFNAAANGSE